MECPRTASRYESQMSQPTIRITKKVPGRLRRALRHYARQGAALPRFGGSLAVAGLMMGALAAPASAELVVLEDGRFLKVKSYQLEGERMRLDLARGGSLAMPLTRIERIVDDEVPWPRPRPEVEAAAAEAVERAFSAGFHEAAPVPTSPYGELIYAAARKHSLNPSLVAAVVRAESAYNPRAVSPKGARGLMQLMPATARRFGVGESELFDPARNVEAGTRYLAWLLERFEGNVEKALAGYNAGEGNVDRYQGVPPFRETRGYLARIYRFLGIDSAVAQMVPTSTSAGG